MKRHSRKAKKASSEYVFKLSPFISAASESKVSFFEHAGDRNKLAGITLLVRQSDCPVPVFETTTLHALKAVDEALK
jgi:hypothetical protein